MTQLHPFDELIEMIARAIAANVVRALPGVAQPNPNQIVAKSVVNGWESGKPGKKEYKRDMRCRWPRCFHISKGPRMGYFCEKHLLQPVAARKSAAVEYKKEHRKTA